MRGRQLACTLGLAVLAASCSGPPMTVVSEGGPPGGFAVTAPYSPAGVGASGIAAGTPVYVSVTRPLQSTQRTVWNPAPPDAFVVSHDIIDGAGNVRIAAGTSVRATVDILPGRRLGREGTIVVDLLSTSTVEGFVVPLDGAYKWDGEDREGLTIGLTVGMVIVYPPFNFLHLLMRGGNVLLPAGSVLSAVVAPG